MLSGSGRNINGGRARANHVAKNPVWLNTPSSTLTIMAWNRDKLKFKNVIAPPATLDVDK